MFYAINQTTKKIVNSYEVFANSSYLLPKNDKWYAHPNEIQEYDKTKIKDINKIEVRYKKQHTRTKQDGNTYRVSPFFFILNKKKLGIKTKPESPEHKKAKNFIFNNIIEKKQIKIKYSTTQNKEIIETINENYIDFININMEETIYSYNYKRIDVLIPFKKKHEQLGFGIAIEIQFSKQNLEVTNERTIDRCLKGYSVVWLNKNDFIEYDDYLELFDDVFNNVFSYAYVLYEGIFKNSIKTANHKLQNISRLWDDKLKEGLSLINQKINDLNNEFKYLNNDLESNFALKKIELNEHLLGQLRKCSKCNESQVFVKGISKTTGKDFAMWRCDYCSHIDWV